MSELSPADAFTRDFAKLVAKYGPRAVGDSLRMLAAAPVDDVARLMDSLAQRQSPDRSNRRRRTKPGPGKRRSPAQTDSELSALRDKLMSREALPTAAALRAYAAAIGVKEAIPRDRRSAIRSLIDHLSQLPSDSREKALAVVAHPPPDETASSYQEWTRTILGESRVEKEARARAEIERMFKMRLATVPLTAQDLESLTRAVEIAINNPGQAPYTYPIVGDDGRALLRFGEEWQELGVSADGKHASLAQVAGAHRSVLDEVRTWDVWRPLREGPS